MTNPNNCGKMTIDNIRRSLSAFFFGWKKKIIIVRVSCFVFGNLFTVHIFLNDASVPRLIHHL